MVLVQIYGVTRSRIFEASHLYYSLNLIKTKTFRFTTRNVLCVNGLWCSSTQFCYQVYWDNVLPSDLVTTTVVGSVKLSWINWLTDEYPHYRIRRISCRKPLEIS